MINSYSMGYPTSNKLRPLNIKFDIYSDSEDNEFKSELVLLMISSVQELRVAAANAFHLRNADIFKKAAHKAKSTIVILDDNEFAGVVEDYKSHLVELESRLKDDLNPCKIEKLNEVCDSIVESLEKEAEQLRSS
jgi:hypothetical protein